MASCNKIRVKNRSVCASDINEPVLILQRTLRAPKFGERDYDESGIKFGDKDVVLRTWAGVETNRGYRSFDGVGLNSNTSDLVYTHKFFLRYDPVCEITSENWIEFNCNLYQIVDVINIDEKNRFLEIKTVKKGESNIMANLA